jgi:hypothetical protein
MGARCKKSAPDPLRQHTRPVADFEPVHRPPKLLAAGFFLSCDNNASLPTFCIALDLSLVY